MSLLVVVVVVVFAAAVTAARSEGLTNSLTDTVPTPNVQSYIHNNAEKAEENQATYTSRHVIHLEVTSEHN